MASSYILVRNAVIAGFPFRGFLSQGMMTEESYKSLEPAFITLDARIESNIKKGGKGLGKGQKRGGSKRLNETRVSDAIQSSA